MNTVRNEFALTEYQFYRMYLEIQNAVVPKKLTNQEIELMSIICCKPMGWLLDSKKSTNGRSKKYELAEELGIKSPAIYALILSIQSKDYLIKADDDFLYLPKPIDSFRKVIKEKLKQEGEFTFDYVFRFKIGEDAE